MPTFNNQDKLFNIRISEKEFRPNLLDYPHDVEINTNIGIISYPRYDFYGLENYYEYTKVDICYTLARKHKKIMNTEPIKTKRQLYNIFRPTSIPNDCLGIIADFLISDKTKYNTYEGYSYKRSIFHLKNGILPNDLNNIIADYAIPDEGELFTHSETVEYNNSLVREEDNVLTSSEIRMSCNLVVCSPGTLSEWAVYKARATWGHYGFHQNVKIIRRESEFTNLENLNNYDIVVVSRTRLRDIYECKYKHRKWTYKNIVWQRVFIDMYKKFHTKSPKFLPPLKCRYLWFLCKDLVDLKQDIVKNSKSFINRTLYDLAHCKPELDVLDNLRIFTVDQTVLN